MSRGATTVEQAGAGQEHCASADRADSPDSSSNSFQPAHRFRINFILLDRVAAGHEQRIDLSAHFAKRPIRGDAQTAVGNQRSARRNSHDFDRINRRRSGIRPWRAFPTRGRRLEAVRPGRESRRRARPRTRSGVCSVRMTVCYS